MRLVGIDALKLVGLDCSGRCDVTTRTSELIVSRTRSQALHVIGHVT